MKSYSVGTDGLKEQTTSRKQNHQFFMELFSIDNA